MVEETGGGVGSLGFVSLETGGVGGSVVDGTTPVPGGVDSGIVTGNEDTIGGSGALLSVAFTSGGSTLVITETTSLMSDFRGSSGVGSAVVVGAVVIGAVEIGASVVDSLTTPLGAITMPALLLLGVGARDTAGSDVGSGSEVGGFEIGIEGASDGFALGCWLTGASEVKLGSGFVPLFFPAVGFGATKTVLCTTTVVTAAATLGNGASDRDLVRSEKSACLFVDFVDSASSELGTGVSSEVIVALENCRLMCRGKYILLPSVASWPATEAAATKAATKTEVVRILYSLASRHALPGVELRVEGGYVVICKTREI